MRTITKSLLACLVAGALPVALAQPAAPSARGELLYSTHCIACHTKQVHWRQQKLATDWASLERQVRRWAGNAGLGWSDEEIGDVARYLNAHYYRFTAPSVVGAHGAATRVVARARIGSDGETSGWLYLWRGDDAVPPQPEMLA